MIYLAGLKRTQQVYPHEALVYKLYIKSFRCQTVTRHSKFMFIVNHLPDVLRLIR